MDERRRHWWQGPIGTAIRAGVRRRNATPTVAPDTPLLTDLVAYWDLDETSGTRADSHTNGLDLTDNNTVGSTTGVGGVGTAAAFVAANSEFLSIASLSLSQGTVVSFGGWVRWDSAAFFNGFMAFRQAGGSPRMSAHANGTTIYVEFPGNYGSASSAYSAGVFAHVFVVYDGNGATNADRLKLYVDGVAKTLTFSGTIPASLPGTEGVFRIGYYAGYLEGSAQGCGVWERVVTSDEITWLYNSGSAARTYADVAAWTG